MTGQFTVFELWEGDVQWSYLKALHFLFILVRIIVVDSVRCTTPASSGQSPYMPQHQVPGASDPPQGRRGPDLPPLQLPSTWHAHNLGPLPAPCQAPSLFLQEIHAFLSARGSSEEHGSRDGRKSQKMTGVFTKEKAEGDYEPVPTDSSLLYRASPAQARLSRS